MIALRTRFSLAGLIVTSLLALPPTHLQAQTALKTAPGARVTTAIQDAERTKLTGHVRPFLSAATDTGRVDDNQPTAPMMLMFSRTARQQADLDSLVDQLHNKQSATFHQWLTPQQFGARFQPVDTDVAAVKAWLESKGFTVLDVAPSKTFISFKGTVGQLRSAFHADLHHVTLNGESHMATINDPDIPTALAGVVASINKLDDFSPKPLVKPFGAFDHDLKTGKVTAAKGTKLAPTFDGSESGSPFYEVGPQDFYTIYNENPLLAAGITGAGQTIAVIEEVQVATADVNTFRAEFGLPTYPATPTAAAGGVNYMLGSASGLGGYSSCLLPVTQANGKTSGEESEADIDLQWAGAVAPNATIDFVACGGTAGGDGSAPGAYGTDHAAQYVANYLYSTVVAASMSYGECEGDLTSTNMAYYNGQWEQYAAEGITAVISTGDGGAEQCYQNSTHATTLAPSVNGFGSSAYNLAAGGTDFSDLYISANYTKTGMPVSTWWNPTNTAAEGSAVGYIPETTWAGYCSGQLFSSYLQNEGSTALGTTYTPSAICSKSTGTYKSYLEVVGGAGGVSTYNTIPTWQSVYGIGLNSVSSTYRNLPDVSLFASNGWWSHFLPYCESDSYACTTADYAAGDMGAGGTSYVAPQLAGLMALISQQTGSRQGVANYTFYALGAQEYGTVSTPSANITACSGSNVATGARPPASCIFYDISNDTPSLQGGSITAGNFQPCTAADVDCYKGLGTTYGVNVVPGTVATNGVLGFTVSPGFDDVTGLGSLNIQGLVTNWTSVTPTFTSATALTSNVSTVGPSTTATLTATVTAPGRGGAVAPAGLVTFYNGSTSGANLGSGTISQSCSGTGSATSCSGVAVLTVAGSAVTPGNDSIIAYFGGDGANDAVSTSTALPLKVYAYPVGNLEKAVDATTIATSIPQTDTIYVGGWAADVIDGSSLTSVNVYVDGVLAGAAATGISRPDVASSTGNSSYATSGYSFTEKASSLSVGTHAVTVVATDSGGYATTYGPLSITVTAVYKVPVGTLEKAVDASTVSTSIPQTDTLYVGGWAGDPQDGSPMSNLKVYIDGTLVGTPTTGISRPDVASSTGNSSYANSGYSFTMPVSTLSVGSHSVTVIGIDSKGLSTTWGPLTFTVTAVYKAPIGNLEQAIDATTHSTTVSKADTLFVSGWAADYQASNGQVSTVTIYIDGNAAGNATLGVSRPDVASAYSQPSWTNTGFNFTYAAASLSSGTHTITMKATDALALSTTFGPVTITVQ